MLGTAKRFIQVATNSPARSDAAGHGGLVALVFAGVVLYEIILCGLIIARIACETAESLRFMKGWFVPLASLDSVAAGWARYRTRVHGLHYCYCLSTVFNTPPLVCILDIGRVGRFGHETGL